MIFNIHNLSMRDVTPKDFDPQFKLVIDYLIDFVKNPIKKIMTLPDWTWLTLISLQFILAVASGVLSGLLAWNFYYILSGLILMPIVSTTAAFLLTFFLYYYFQFFENRTVNFRPLFTMVLLASIPFYVFQILSAILSVISLVGFGFTSLLGIVGLKENFQVEKKRSYQIVGFIFFLVLFAWISNRITAGAS